MSPINLKPFWLALGGLGAAGLFAMVVSPGVGELAQDGVETSTDRW